MNRAMRRQAAKSGRTNTTYTTNTSYTAHQNRYFMDFIAFPYAIRTNAIKVVPMVRIKGHAAIADLYNMTARANGCREFGNNEFSIRTINEGTREMLYITMPATSSASPMACTHIAVTYTTDHDDYSDIRVFHIERGGLVPGMTTTAIGEMSESFHANYGEAMATDDDNIRRIMEIANEDATADIPISDIGASA